MPSITGSATLLLIIIGPTFQGNIISDAFLKLIKCSFSRISFCLMNSKAKLQGLGMAVRDTVHVQNHKS